MGQPQTKAYEETMMVQEVVPVDLSTLKERLFSSFENLRRLNEGVDER